MCIRDRSYIVQKAAAAVFSEKGQKECEENLSYYKKNAKVIADTLRELHIPFYGGVPVSYTHLMGIINQIAQEHPILVDKYLQGKEVEVDAVCDGEDILIPGIMEHIERAGIHSGDSVSVYPAKSLTTDIQAVITDYTRRLARALHVRGLINIQFIVCEGRVYVIEVNPRSSRTVPYISKVTGIPIIELAVKVMNGAELSELGYGTGPVSYTHLRDFG